MTIEQVKCDVCGKVEDLNQGISLGLDRPFIRLCMPRAKYPLPNVHDLCSVACLSVVASRYADVTFTSGDGKSSATFGMSAKDVLPLEK
jgi:hypothetical protein